MIILVARLGSLNLKTLDAKPQTLNGLKPLNPRPQNPEP